MTITPMFLTREELRELTGYQLTGRQIRWLEANGVPFYINRLKQPVVVREVLATKSGARPAADEDDFKLGHVA